MVMDPGAIVGIIFLSVGIAALAFHRSLTRLVVRLYARHGEQYPGLYPGPLRRLVQDPSWVRWVVFSVALAWTAIGIVAIASD
jgi:hypothetical protein